MDLDLQLKTDCKKFLLNYAIGRELHNDTNIQKKYFNYNTNKKNKK